MYSFRVVDKPDIFRFEEVIKQCPEHVFHYFPDTLDGERATGYAIFSQRRLARS